MLVEIEQAALQQLHEELAELAQLRAELVRAQRATRSAHRQLATARRVTADLVASLSAVLGETPPPSVRGFASTLGVSFGELGRFLNHKAFQPERIRIRQKLIPLLCDRVGDASSFFFTLPDSAIVELAFCLRLVVRARRR